MRRSVSIQVTGSGADADRAENVIRTALVAAGFRDVEAEKPSRHLSLVRRETDQ